MYLFKHEDRDLGSNKIASRIKLKLNVLTEPRGVVVLESFSIAECLQDWHEREKFLLEHPVTLLDMRGQELDNPLGILSLAGP